MNIQTTTSPADRQNGHAFVLWCKRSDYFGGAWYRQERANRREELSSEVAFRQKHGFETCISIQGLHPDELLAGFQQADAWVKAFSSSTNPNSERGA